MASDGRPAISLPIREDLTTRSPSPSPSSPTTRASNPLSSKITHVLSTSYTDTEFRSALSLLDARDLSNTPATRRQLRLDIQREVLDRNAAIVTDFGLVAQQLKRIGTTINRLNQSYSAMKAHVESAHAATKPTLAEAEALMAQRHDVERKQALLRAFNAHFVLSEDEVEVLTLSSLPVDDQFFSLLARAKQIRKDCEVLLGFENQTLGLEVLERTQKHLNQAFQKLYRWVQKGFKTLNLENAHIDPAARRALRVLAEQPALFQNCLDLFGDAREHMVGNSFFVALTGTEAATGRQVAGVKPIELVAHDALRYVGDMLAWTHSATVGEREALETLFVAEDEAGGDNIAREIQEGRRDNELWRLMNEDENKKGDGDDGDDGGEDRYDAIKALNELVDRDVSGAARILRQRVEQVIQTNEDTMLAYKLANLLAFYRFTFANLLGPNSLLLTCIKNLESEALRQFRSLMRDHIATLQGELQHTPSDLGPPDFLHDALTQLSAILQTYESSLASSAPPASEDTPSNPDDGNPKDEDPREAQFRPILAEAFDPFLTGTESISLNIEPPASSVFLINCLLAAQATLLPHAASFTATRVAELKHSIALHERVLVDSQYLFFRTSSGLDTLISALTPFFPPPSSSPSPPVLDEEARAKIRALPALQLPSLAAASQALDDFLPNALMDAHERLRYLQDSGIARRTTEEAAERFCGDFGGVEAVLAACDGDVDADADEGDTGETGDGRERLRDVFPRTEGEIRVLLS